MRARNRAALIGSVPLALTLLGHEAHAQAEGACSPLSYGAVGDGVTDNTVAIQTAVDRCAARGGGIVALTATPKGEVYLTSPFQLKSHVILQVGAGVTLQGTADESKYTRAFIDYPYRNAAPYEALISAYQATGVGIIGPGTIDGAGNQLQPNGGPSWWTQAEDYAATNTGVTNPTTGIAYYTAPYTDVPTSNGEPRPFLIEFYQCAGVLVGNVTVQNSPFWHLALRFDTDVIVAKYTVDTASTSPNTDGVDLDGSQHVLIEDADINDGDDDVAIKAGLPVNAEIPNDPKEVGLPTLPTEDVLVNELTIGTGHGVSVGSEAAYGVNHVLIQNLTYDGTSDGFRIKTGRDRGSQIYDITLQNIAMTDVGLPLSLQAFYPASAAPNPPPLPIPVTATTPYVHDVTIQNLTATGATSQSVIEGLPESCMLRMNLTDVNIGTSNKGLALENMTGTFDNVGITPADNPTVPFVVNENVTVATKGTTSPISPSSPATAVACSDQPQQEIASPAPFWGASVNLDGLF